MDTQQMLRFISVISQINFPLSLCGISAIDKSGRRSVFPGPKWMKYSSSPNPPAVEKTSVSVVFKHPHTQILKDIEIHKHTQPNTNQVTTLHHRNQLNQGPNLCSGRRLAFYSSAVSHPARLHLNVVFCICICICMYLYL